MRINPASPGRCRAMASVALRQGRNMVGWFNLRVDSLVGSAMTSRTIAGGTRTGRAAMICNRRCEGGGIGVTGVALRRCGNMIGRFA